jgi:subtilisin-like proprotein convertase family protein
MKKYNLEFNRFLLAVVFVFITIHQAAAGTITFTNPAAITINDFGPANPYPATIVISGLTTPILDINVAINGLSHTFPSDVGILLVGPGGQKVVLMDGAGGVTPAINVNLLFDDEASSGLSSSGPLSSGSFKPTNFFPTDIYNPPALAAGPYASQLSVFDNQLVNGTWSLFVKDFSAGDSGLISGGFGLQVTTPEPSTLMLYGFGLIVLASLLRRRLR